MSISNVRGVKMPKLVQVPDKFTMEEFERFFVDWHAALYREIRQLASEIGKLG